MDRRIVLGAGALALAVGALVGPGVAAAVPVPVTLSGPLTCSLTASYRFSTPLNNTGAASTTLAVKGKLTGCTGAGATNGTVTVSGGHFLATSSGTVANSWPGISAGAALPNVTGVITWKATGGKVTATTVTLTAQAISADSGTDVVSLFATPVLSAGSYATQSAATAGQTGNVAAHILAAKAPKSGVKTVTFGKSGGTFTIGA